MSPIAAIPGMLIIVVITVLGFVANKFVKKIPTVIWVSIIALLITSSINPYQQSIVKYTDKINFMALATFLFATLIAEIGFRLTGKFH